jgi:hypothetical protein
MGETKIEKVDAVFNDAKSALQAAEDFRAGLEDAKSAMMAVSGASTLKEGNLTDAVTLFFWGLGADMGVDKLAEMKPKLQMSEPYLEMPELDAACSDECKEFLDALKCYVNTVGASVDTVTEITTKLSDATTKASELKGTIKQDATDAGLGAMDTVKAVKTVASNCSSVCSGTKKMTELGSTAQNAVADMKALGEALAGILVDAAKNVTEGTEKGAKKMPEFADKQHSKENLKAEEANKNADKLAYDAMKQAGKKLPSGKKEAAKEDGAPASAAEAAPAAEEAAAEAKPEDVLPEVKDV